MDEGERYSYVYVAKANSKDEAELVYIFNYVKGALVDIDFDVDVPANIAKIVVNGSWLGGTTATIAKSDDASVVITPNTGCEVTEVLVNGDKINIRERNDGTYTFTLNNVKKDTVVDVVTNKPTQFVDLIIDAPNGVAVKYDGTNYADGQKITGLAEDQMVDLHRCKERHGGCGRDLWQRCYSYRWGLHDSD